MTNKNYTASLYKIVNTLENIFYIDKDYYLEHSDSNFKVRPGYGYDKFYLDWVEGSYDMSLQSLVNFILYEKKLYKKFLSKEAYKEVIEIVKNYPESIPDISEKYEEDQQMIDNIMWISCSFMGCKFKEVGLDYSSFEDAGYMDNKELNFFDSCYIYSDKIISDAFLYRLDDYIDENTPIQEQIDNIVVLSKSLFNIKDFIHLATTIYSIDNISSKKIIEFALENVTKKSEYLQIALFVKDEEYLNDIKWAKDIIVLKEKL